MKEETDKLRELLESFDSGMLVTHDGQRMRARPMAIARVEPRGDLWFITGRESGKVREIEENPEVSVVLQKGERASVSILGRAEVVLDRNKVAEVWKESFKTWFPGGKDDPEICLIHVRGEEAEYWDTRGAKGIRYLFSAARAYAKGERPEIVEGEQHGKVRLANV